MVRVIAFVGVTPFVVFGSAFAFAVLAMVASIMDDNVGVVTSLATATVRAYPEGYSCARSCGTSGNLKQEHM